MGITSGLWRQVSLVDGTVLGTFYIDQFGGEYRLTDGEFVPIEGHGIGLGVIEGDVSIEPLEYVPAGVALPDW